MMQTESVLDAIEQAKNGHQSMTRCPAHDDHDASLHVSPGTKQPVVMMCHANCETPDILAAANLDFQVMMKPKDEGNHGRWSGEEMWTPVKDDAGRSIQPSHIYRYTDEHGALLYEVLRLVKPNGKKTFVQRRPDPEHQGRYKWNLNGARRVLYHLPEVIEAVANGETVYVVEGEKDVESWRRRGYTATCGAMGAGKWEPEYTQVLTAASVVIIADADEPGRNHAHAVKEQLDEAGSVVEIRESAHGKDSTDHFDAGGSVDSFIVTVPALVEGKDGSGMDILDAIEREVKASSYVIPRVLAAGDRWLLTGFEGHGKSTFCRQLAVQVAAGIHPWTLQEMPPQKVMVVDSENHPDQVLESWRDMIGLAARHGRPVERGMLILQEEWDHEINLNEPAGKRWLLERVHAHQPALVVIGPLYNLANKDLTEHSVVGEMKSAINEARGICGSAFIMEHHAPHRGNGDKERAVRPYGSSTFLKWPDFGYGLRPEETEGYYELQKTRFPRVRSRHFPGWVRWGKPNTLEWPWMAIEAAEAEFMGFNKKSF